MSITNNTKIGDLIPGYNVTSEVIIKNFGKHVKFKFCSTKKSAEKYLFDIGVQKLKEEYNQ